MSPTFMPANVHPPPPTPQMNGPRIPFGQKPFLLKPLHHLAHFADLLKLAVGLVQWIMQALLCFHSQEHCVLSFLPYVLPCRWCQSIPAEQLLYKDCVTVFMKYQKYITVFVENTTET